MSIVRFIKQLSSKPDAGDLSESDAHDMFAAMLDGGVPDLELGACLGLLRMRQATSTELLGFYRAMAERVHSLTPPATALRPLVFATYSGAREEANLLPLLVLLLQRMGVPAVLHGTLQGQGRIATAYILRELGVLPSASLAQAQKSLDTQLLAFLPTAVLCPGLADLLALHSRLGMRNPAHSLVGLLDPFNEGAVRLVSADGPEDLNRLDSFLVATGFDALLMRGTEGEPFANPRQRPRIRYFRQGESSVLFDEEVLSARGISSQPMDIDAGTTARWIRQAMAGQVAIPHPLVNQLACCLFASGYTDDMNQAKAIAAVEAGGLTAHGSASSVTGSDSRVPT